MVNLMTSREYKAKTGHRPVLSSFIFEEEMPYEINPKSLEEIVRDVEKTSIFCGLPIAKFGLGYSISWDRISSGCKTVILIEYYTEKKQFKCLSLDECGDNALSYCFKLLDDNPYITGVLSQHDDDHMQSCKGYVVSVDGGPPVIWERAYRLGVQS